MNIISKKKIDLSQYTNLVFCLLPISFILGNLATNINIILLCIFGFLHLKNKIFLTKFENTTKIILTFFFIIFLSTSLSFFKSLYFNTYNQENLTNLIKSIAFFRFFLLLLIIYYLNNFNILKFKQFYISVAFAALIVSFDIIFQYIFSFNLIGLDSYGHHNTSFFGDEYIAGGFVQNFSFFSIFFIAYSFENKKNLRFALTSFVTFFLGASILLSGNKMPLILFLIGLLISILMNKDLRKILLTGLILFLIFFKFMFSYDSHVTSQYKSVFSNLYIINNLLSEFNIIEEIDLKNYKKVKNNENNENNEISSFPLYKESLFYVNPSPQARLFLTAIDTWKKNKLFGNGIKSFRTDCHKLDGSEYSFQEDVIKFKKNRLCSNHPHNYYLEVLTETGVVGLLNVFILAIIFIVFIFKNYKYLRGGDLENLMLLASVVSLILELFPFKSSGSLFTTNNATYIILIASILFSNIKKLKIN